MKGFYRAIQVFFSIDGKMRICRTCDNMLHKGKMPVQAKAMPYN